MARNFIFEEPNPTGSHPRDLIGLCKSTETLVWNGNWSKYGRLYERKVGFMARYFI